MSQHLEQVSQQYCAVWTMYSEYYKLHFASTRSYNSWCDNAGPGENSLHWYQGSRCARKNI